jgi:hypothetical protein
VERDNTDIKSKRTSSAQGLDRSNEGKEGDQHCKLHQYSVCVTYVNYGGTGISQEARNFLNKCLHIYFCEEHYALKLKYLKKIVAHVFL